MRRHLRLFAQRGDAFSGAFPIKSVCFLSENSMRNRPRRDLPPGPVFALLAAEAAV